MSDSERREPANSELRGVDGWLLFFCMWYSLFVPAFTLLAFLSLWTKIGPHPFPVQKELAIIATVISAIVTIYGIVVGVIVWKGNKRGRNIAGLFLVIYLLIAVGIDVGLHDWAGQHFGAQSAQKLWVILGPRALVEIGIILAWLAYFTFSRRVRNTYCGKTEKLTD